MRSFSRSSYTQSREELGHTHIHIHTALHTVATRTMSSETRLMRYSRFSSTSSTHARKRRLRIMRASNSGARPTSFLP